MGAVRVDRPVHCLDDSIDPVSRGVPEELKRQVEIVSRYPLDQGFWDESGSRVLKRRYSREEIIGEE